MKRSASLSYYYYLVIVLFRNVGQLSRKTVTFTEKSKEESAENSNGDISIGDKPVKSSPVSHLWNSEDGVTPLVRPEDAVSTGL